ncbi:hypothetical protein JW872_00610 [Candidatus Babeliales bacterium]|nr:hypothetical protein [Candidatus Babeliales bacterium]
MLSNESLMTFLFKIANLAILVGTLVYLVKNYLLDTMREGIKSHKKQVRLLEVEQLRLIEQSAHIEHDITQQQAYGSSLIENIEKWSNAEKIKRKLLIQAHTEHEKRLLDKRKVQSEYRVQEGAEQEVITAALHDAEQLLKQYFMHRNPNAAFVGEIVEKLKTRSGKQ